MLEDLGCLLINSSRSKAYLQKMIRNSLEPAVLIHLDLKKGKAGTAVPEDTNPISRLIIKAFKDRKYFLYDPSLKGSSLAGSDEARGNRYSDFDPGEHVLDTAEKHGIKCVRVEALNINDPEVIRALKDAKQEYFVFGGGGILKAEILGIGKKFLHFHPGKVPYFRGSHCIEWSVLLAEKCAVTGFIMNEEIDGGEIVAIEEFDFPVLESGGIPPFYSAHIRSELLVEVLTNYAKTGKFKAATQDMSEGETYYKMHPALANLVFHRLQTHEDAGQ